jgi:hypothetical protein
MSKIVASLACLALTALSGTAHAQAQTPAPAAPQRPALPPPAPKTGNPTPGTPQPDPPVLADRITVSGCLTHAPGAGAAPVSAPTTPASNRFILSGAKKDGVVPPETGTSSVATAAAASSYRLEALESQLSPFVNARIEVSGEVKGSAEGPPLLLVEFVRKVAAKCQ